jgi:AraC-like DNA-binding protein
MDVTIQLSSTLSIASILLTLYLILQIRFFKKNINFTDYIFLYFLGTIFFINTFFFILGLKITMVAAYMLPFFIFGVLSVSPIMWRHLNSMVYPHKKQKMAKHFILPSLIGLFYLVLLYPSLLWFDKEMKNSALLILQNLTLYLFGLMFVVQNVVYVVMSFMLYKKHKKNIETTLSYTENVSLEWILVYVWGYVFFLIGLIIVNLMSGAISNIIHDSIFILYIAYIGNRVFVQEMIYKENQDTSTIQDEKEVGNPLEKNTELYAKLNNELKDKIENQQKFLDNDLSVFSLASELNTNTNYLSFIVNKEYSTSFVNFINSYRVEYAKDRLIADDSKILTIETIGYESGFKSKSSFNAAFKRFVGMTPSEYQRKYEELKQEVA